MTIQAKLKHGNDPILNAKVYARRTYKYAATNLLQLFDDGGGEDLHKDDGIYTGTFGSIKEKSMSSIFIEVKGIAGKSKILKLTRVYKGPKLVYYEPSNKN